MKITTKELWDNYESGIKKKVIKGDKMDKDYFFQLHEDNGKPSPYPSHVISQMIMDYYKLHNHHKYFNSNSKTKDKCLICKQKKV